MSDTQIHFKLPTIHENSSGWGPTMTAIRNEFKEVPYSPFSKSDILGKIADAFTTQTSNKPTTKQQQKKKNRDYPAQAFGSAGSAFNFYGTEESLSSGFQVIERETKKKVTRVQQRRRYTPQPTRGATTKKPFNNQQTQRRKPGTTAATPNRNFNNRRFKKGFTRERQNREASVEVRANWKVLEQIDFTDLRKIVGEDPDSATDLVTAGSIEYYDIAFDSVTINRPQRLVSTTRILKNPTTTEDPIIKDLSLTRDWSGCKAVVFATDSILAHIMTSPRSVYSWDIVIRKVDNQIFLDKRENSHFDLPTVNETAPTPPKRTPDNEDDPNTADKLALEAAYINRLLSQQVLVKNKKYDFNDENPFKDENDEENEEGSKRHNNLAPIGYRYRKWELGEGIVLVVRCEVHAAIERRGERKNLTPAYAHIRALNEYDPKLVGIDWRLQFSTQRGTVLATELQNNSHKLSKWAAQALISGTNYLKLGYVSRVSPRDPSKHVILAIQSYTPAEFANLLGLSSANMWGILRSYIKTCMKVCGAKGTYVFLKDPYKGLVRIYDVPDDAIDVDKEDEEDDSAAVDEDEDEDEDAEDEDENDDLVESDTVGTEDG